MPVLPPRSRNGVRGEGAARPGSEEHGLTGVPGTHPVVILCPTAWGVRNVAHSGMLPLLSARGAGARVLTSSNHPRPITSEAGPTSELLSARIAPARGDAALGALFSASFARRHTIATHGVFGPWMRRHLGPLDRLRHAGLELLSVIGSREPFYSWQGRMVEQRLRRATEVAPMIEQLRDLRPALLVSTTCVVRDEYPYLVAAEVLNIPTLACILSFDNLSSRGVVPRFGHYAVWNRRMRQQLLRYYPEIDAARVHVTGTPQFDFHLSHACRWSREATLASLGMAHDQRYLVYAANAALFTPTEPDLIRAFAGRCAESPELRRHRIVVRPHPLDDMARWHGLADPDGRIVVSVPWGGQGGLPVETDQARLVSTLLHADVSLNTASTMSLDAAVLDTPVVCVGFAAAPGTLEDRFLLQAHYTEHYRPIVESGGVSLATSMEELLDEVTAYVRDRSRRQAQRARLVVEECGPVDGRAAERIAALIAQLAGTL